MAEFDEKTTKAPQEIVAKKEVEKQLSKVNTITPYRGHTLFKVHKTTLDIQPAVIEDTATTSKDAAGMLVVHRKVIVEEGYAYFSALNKKNVIKKLKQLVDPIEVDRLLAELSK